MREVIKVINLILSLGLVVPVSILINSLRIEIEDDELKKVQKFFFIVFCTILSTTVVTLIFYASSACGLIEGRVAHNLSPYRSTLVLISLWVITIAFYLSRKGKL